MRAFVAVQVPRRVAGRCREVCSLIRSLRLDARFVKPDSIHLTLKFLGRLSADRLCEVGDALQDAVREIRPFSLKVRGVGLFPGEENARIVWIGVHPRPQIELLQRSLEARLEEAGFGRERRAFHPHLTLVRLKSRKNLHRLTEFIESEGREIDAGSMTVRGVRLYESLLKHGGAEYHSLMEAPFPETGGPPERFQ